MTPAPPVGVGDVVMVSLEEAAFTGHTAGAVAEPGLNASIVVVVPDVSPGTATRVEITGITYEIDAKHLDAFGHGLARGMPA